MWIGRHESTSPSVHPTSAVVTNLHHGIERLTRKSVWLRVCSCMCEEFTEGSVFVAVADIPCVVCEEPNRPQSISMVEAGLGGSHNREEVDRASHVVGNDVARTIRLCNDVAKLSKR